jgi:hypothetical protein
VKGREKKDKILPNTMLVAIKEANEMGVRPVLGICQKEC